MEYLKKLIKNFAISFIVFILISCTAEENTIIHIKKDNKMQEDVNKNIIGKVSRYLEEALKKLDNKNINDANELAIKGIEILGDKYIHGNLIDDTGMKLVLATNEESKGNNFIAANLRINVLRDRLEIALEKQ